MFKRFTSAISGRFVSKATADRHPDTTMGSQVYRPPVVEDKAVTELVEAATKVVNSQITTGALSGMVMVDANRLSGLRVATLPFTGKTPRD